MVLVPPEPLLGASCRTSPSQARLCFGVMRQGCGRASTAPASVGEGDSAGAGSLPGACWEQTGRFPHSEERDKPSMARTADARVGSDGSLKKNRVSSGPPEHPPPAQFQPRKRRSEVAAVELRPKPRRLSSSGPRLAHVAGTAGEGAGSRAWHARQGQEYGRDHDDGRGPAGYHSLEKLWDPRAIAPSLGPSVDTAKRLAEKPGVPLYRPAGRYIALRSELNAWLT